MIGLAIAKTPRLTPTEPKFRNNKVPIMGSQEANVLPRHVYNQPSQPSGCPHDRLYIAAELAFPPLNPAQFGSRFRCQLINALGIRPANDEILNVILNVNRHIEDEIGTGNNVLPIK